jgi:predicted O-methyltransferase YrrM
MDADETFDLVFIDADKAGHMTILNILLDKPFVAKNA